MEPTVKFNGRCYMDPADQPQSEVNNNAEQKNGRTVLQEESI